MSEDKGELPVEPEIKSVHVTVRPSKNERCSVLSSSSIVAGTHTQVPRLDVCFNKVTLVAVGRMA